LRFRYWLAVQLHKTVEEINQMDVREYMGWIAYFEEQK